MGATLLDDIRTSKQNLNQASVTINQASVTINQASVTINQAHTAFTSHFNTFLTLSEQLDIKLKEIETREKEVEIRENDVRNKNQLLQEREKTCVEREQKVEAREKDVTAKEQKWNETETQMQQNAAKVPSVVQFNISGTRFASTKERILKHKGSLFEQMLVTDHQLTTKSGEYFIDRDPKLVCHVISFLLNESLQAPSNFAKRLAIEKEFDFFKIPFKFAPPRFYNNDLISENKFYVELNKWIPNRRFQLIYKASVDGFAATDFHKWCDDKGPTLTVIHSGGYIFGGYTKVSWDTTYKWQRSKDGFIFTLTNPHNIPPTKYSCNKPNYAIHCDTTLGPSFGVHDLHIENNSHQNYTSHSYFPHSYTDTTGQGSTTFTGTANFTTNEIEVYLVL